MTMLATAALRVSRRGLWTQLPCILRSTATRSSLISGSHMTQGSRFESTPSAPVSRETSKPRYAYPERLCVYHAGTGRVTFLACLKLSTLFIFVFFGFVVTPAYYQKEGLSLTVARTTLSAIVPVVFVAYVTSPFVTFVHLRLPPFARQSEEMLRRYVRSLPPQTELDVTTMSFIAKPRASRLRVEELKPVSRRWGIVNLARDATAENASRPWYMFRAVDSFNIQSNNMPKVSWVWDIVYSNIERQAMI
ncbi:hypothetical protein F5Y15DRAFT_313405 [Xylariaceae sp. FL0016]|nr:hypothetical protein F5Y15DRAFT_313405 [Xylariaceae sp. FL0016]